MATRLTHTMAYDAALADVGAMLDDPAYRARVIEAQGGLRGTFEMETSGDVTTAVVDMVQPAADIPSYARKFIGDEINIVQREAWTSQAYAELHVTIPGKPGQMVGSITLDEVEGSTTETVEVEITVNIPLVGGKIERLISEMLTKALHAEEQVARDYLSR